MGFERSQAILMAVNVNGVYTNCVDSVLNTWQETFKTLLNCENVGSINEYGEQTDGLGNNKQAVNSLNKNKCAGFDDMYTSKSYSSKSCIHVYIGCSVFVSKQVKSRSLGTMVLLLLY